MASFQLTKDGSVFEFDPFGGVNSGGVAVGQWATNNNNQIVLTETDGTTTAFDVVWQFNDDNHLVIQSDHKEVFNFNLADSNRPFYKTENAVLIVFPDEENSFSFQLRGEW